MDNKKRMQLPRAPMPGPPPPPHTYRQPPHGQYHPHQHPMMIMQMPPPQGARGAPAQTIPGRGRPGPPPPPHGYGPPPPHHRHPYNPQQGMMPPMIPIGMHPQHGGPRPPPHHGARGPMPQIPPSMGANGSRGTGNNRNPNMQQQKGDKSGIQVSNSMGKVKHPFVKKTTGIKWTTEEVRAIKVHTFSNNEVQIS